MANERLISNARNAARKLALILEQKNIVIVFAESCTAGLVSGLLAQVPGISNWMAGCFATYQNEAKQDWLNVEADLIAEHTAVSREVTLQMAINSLSRTPRASISLAVTGHLEPDATDEAPACLICIAQREASGDCSASDVVKKVLSAETRAGRQWQAAIHCLACAINSLEKK
ncbi:MAG: nicotinamide-nucleotide amidohydrolase family protein [Planctomycetota bacterium]